MARRKTRILISVFIALLLANVVWLFFHSQIEAWYSNLMKSFNKVETISLLSEPPKPKPPAAKAPPVEEAKPEETLPKSESAKEREQPKEMHPAETSPAKPVAPEKTERAARDVAEAPQVRSESVKAAPPQPKEERPAKSPQPPQIEKSEPKRERAEAEKPVEPKPRVKETAKVEEITPPTAEKPAAPPTVPPVDKGKNAARMIEPIPPSERPPKRAAPPKEEQPEPPAPALPPLKRICYEVGPFANRKQAQPLRKELQGLGAEVEYETRYSEQAIGYWVYLPRESSDALGRLKVEELRLKGLSDVVLVPSGKSKNMISLGVFKYKKTADERMADAKKLGYAPKMEEHIIGEPDTWIKTSYLEIVANKIEWPYLLERYQNAKYLPVLCD